MILGQTNMSVAGLADIESYGYVCFWTDVDCLGIMYIFVHQPWQDNGTFFAFLVGQYNIRLQHSNRHRIIISLHFLWVKYIYFTRYMSYIFCETMKRHNYEFNISKKQWNPGLAVVCVQIRLVLKVLIHVIKKPSNLLLYGDEQDDSKNYCRTQRQTMTTDRNTGVNGDILSTIGGNIQYNRELGEAHDARSLGNKNEE